MFSIGYDLGSSSVKAVLFDVATKQSIATATYPEIEMKIESPQENWAEQNPEDWWTNIQKVTDCLFKTTTVQRSDVVSIGIAYQMHGLVCLDKQGQVLRPAIIWCDSRAVAIGEQAFKTIGEQVCLENLLNSPGNFTALKLAWVKENEPEVYQQIDKVMLPGDYIAYKFTDKISTTNTGLSGGVLWDFKQEELSKTVLNYFGFDEKIFPVIVPVFGNQRQITTPIVKEFGFHEEAMVSYRAGDQPNNAFSLNVLEPGEVAATGGTSGVVYGVSNVLKYDENQRVNTFAHVNHTLDKK